MRARCKTLHILCVMHTTLRNHGMIEEKKNESPRMVNSLISNSTAQLLAVLLAHLFLVSRCLLYVPALSLLTQTTARHVLIISLLCAAALLPFRHRISWTGNKLIA